MKALLAALLAAAALTGCSSDDGEISDFEAYSSVVYDLERLCGVKIEGYTPLRTNGEVTYWKTTDGQTLVNERIDGITCDGDTREVPAFDGGYRMTTEVWDANIGQWVVRG